MRSFCLVMIVFVYACGSGQSNNAEDIGPFDSGGEEYSCEGDRPINVDGYFNSGFSPALLSRSSINDNFESFTHVENGVDAIAFRIGISATYNLTDSDSQSNASIREPSTFARLSCIPPGRISVGPNLMGFDVTADQALNDNFPAGTSLNEIVDIAVAPVAYDANFPPTVAFVPNALPTTSRYTPLREYLDSAPIAPVAFFLRLNTIPDAEGPYVFTLTYTLDTGMSGAVNTPAVLFF